jgi:hypothetical protein
MAISVEKAAEQLHMKKEDLVEFGLKAYLREKLRELRAEITTIYLKYKVSSLEELDQKISKGSLSESDTFEDFTRLDYLESEEEEIRNIMGKSE